MDTETYGSWEEARTLDKDPINAKKFGNLAININTIRAEKAYKYYNEMFDENCKVVEFD